MSQALYGVAAWLFMAGLYGVVTSRDLIHLVICLSVMQSSTCVLLVAIGYRTNQGAPIYAGRPAGSPAVDGRDEQRVYAQLAGLQPIGVLVITRAMPTKSDLLNIRRGVLVCPG